MLNLLCNVVRKERNNFKEKSVHVTESEHTEQHYMFSKPLAIVAVMVKEIFMCQLIILGYSAIAI